MGPVRVLLVDDHELFKRGVRALLSTRPEITICGEAADGVEAAEKARQLQPDVVLMDINMPRMDGLHATRLLHLASPHSKIVILSQHDSSTMVTEAMKAGASAFLTKTQSGPCLLATLEAVAEDRPFDWVAEGARAETRSKAPRKDSAA